jgi:putative tryptophan/tyrosine transport system substrate-binding protein
MQRREFLGLAGGALATACPLVARAQHSVRPPRVVQLSPVDYPAQVNAIRTQLRELGYEDGRNIRLEFRNTGGNVDRLPSLALELVEKGDLDVIVTQSTPAALAAYRATRTIPIVALAAGDPVARGLAQSLAHPGGNVTGVTIFAEETTAKRVELMREVVPRAVRFGTVVSKVNRGALGPETFLEIGRKLGFAAEVISVDDPADLAKALGPDVLARFDALVFVPDIVLSAHIAEVVNLSNLSSKPAIFPSPDWVNQGGFMSFGPDIEDVTRHLVAQLDRVLKGARPGDLPFERPTKFDLRINLRVAKVLGIELSPTLLARANEIIE